MTYIDRSAKHLKEALVDRLRSSSVSPATTSIADRTAFALRIAEGEQPRSSIQPCQRFNAVLRRRLRERRHARRST